MKHLDSMQEQIRKSAENSMKVSGIKEIFDRVSRSSYLDSRVEYIIKSTRVVANALGEELCGRLVNTHLSGSEANDYDVGTIYERIMCAKNKKGRRNVVEGVRTFLLSKLGYCNSSII